MRKLILLPFLIPVLLFSNSCDPSSSIIPIVLSAQSLPITIHVEHLQSIASDNVTNYTIQLDGNSQVPYPNTLDQNCLCVKSADLIISDKNQHTINIRANNIWGSSDPLVIVFSVTVPAKVSNGVLKVGA